MYGYIESVVRNLSSVCYFALHGGYSYIMESADKFKELDTLNLNLTCIRRSTNCDNTICALYFLYVFFLKRR